MSNQGVYQLVLYVVKTQPTAMIKITSEFKIALQKNNYSSFYDDSRQLWSILFESEEVVASFATQITLCKCNLMQNNIENANLYQELKVNNENDAISIESGDSIEIETLVTVVKETKLADIIENTQQKSFKLKLGKNKIPKRIEDLIINMKQGERRLFVLTGSMLAPFFTNLIATNSIVFYDINILKVRFTHIYLILNKNKQLH
jgi:FK506-binding protein 15